MEIKLNTNMDPIGRVASGQPIKSEVKAEGEAVKFDKSEALNQALHQLPDSRVVAVAAAKQKAALSTYPPPETIKKISALLAMNIGQ